MSSKAVSKRISNQVSDPESSSAIPSNPALSKFDAAIQVISDLDAPLTAKTIYAMSDLSDSDRQQLSKVWGTIPVERRRLLVQRLNETSETNFEMDFGAIVRVALTDLDDQLRQAAVEASWADESPDMLNRLMPLATVDPSVDVRAAAASALGRFILLGELGKFPRSLARQAENVAIKVYNNLNDNIDVRRRALEAISNCSRSEVPAMIKSAYKDRNDRMHISAVYAMGRSCDEEWGDIILSELTSPSSEMRYEASQAAGHLELSAAVPYLAQMLDDDDREVVEMAIWSLGEIGGGEAQRLLETMADRASEEGDDALTDAIDDALAIASMAGSDLDFDG